MCNRGVSERKLKELEYYFTGYGSPHDDDILKLIEQNKRYREALEFYADEEVYKENLITKAEYDADGVCISNDEYAPPIIYFDSGEKARKALKGE